MFDENSIVDRVLSGDASAFERLVNRYEHRVYQYALRFLGLEQDACTVTGEIFGRMYRQLGKCTDAQLSTWVFRIATEICAEYQHRKRNTKNAVIRLREDHKEHDLSGEIQIQLLRLARQQREVLLLRDLCGLDDAETSAILHLDETGVRQRLSRARKNLRDLLIKQDVLTTSVESMTFWHNMPKECQNFRELCSCYVDGCISEQDKCALIDHIQECKECAAYLNDLTAIGRTLSHLQEQKQPEDLHDKIMAEAHRQIESMRVYRKKQIHRPMMAILVATAICFILVGSGVIGGLFVNSKNLTLQQESSTSTEDSKLRLIEDVDIPEVVGANSYAFAIAAAGNTDLPELSTSATLLTSDAGEGVEYYVVENDLNLMKKLIDGLESVGYDTEMVNDHQLVITPSAAQGLFIIIHCEDEK